MPLNKKTQKEYKLNFYESIYIYFYIILGFLLEKLECSCTYLLIDKFGNNEVQVISQAVKEFY